MYGGVDVQIIADKANSKEIRIQIQNQNCEEVIPSRSNCLDPFNYEKHIYKEHHSSVFLESSNILGEFFRFDKLSRNFASFCY